MLNTKIKNTIAYRQKTQEEGNELITIIFILPILLWFVFTLIDLHFYFEARRTVQDITSEAAQTVAVLGGNNSMYNTSGSSISVQTQKLLYNKGKCTPSLCPKGYVPRVSCTPTTTREVMQEVRCTTRYKYQSTYGGGLFPAFAKLTASEFTITSVARSQTGF